jgi:hypothetical protein
MFDKICGPDDPCASTCPVKNFGRICPDLPTFLEEVRVILAAEVTPAECEGSPQLAPQPV